jgi:putative heme degradation protein
MAANLVRPEQHARRLVHQLEALGYTVAITNKDAA